MNIINSFDKIKQEIKNNKIQNEIEIIAVSKTFPVEHIMPLVDHGHRHFGENKVQEAEKKWSELKKSITNLKIHMIGKLQSNKAKKAVELFDYIHSLDNEKLANELSKREKEKNKRLGYFIQVNLGSEEQKGGLEVNDLKPFYDHCLKKLNLTILGLMAIPPNDNNPEKYFKKISELNKQFNLQHLSIGMSGDYLKAIRFGASFVRIGSAIFGSRG
jgi:pyridoxal phosphate enzyme (YggS family)